MANETEYESILDSVKKLIGIDFNYHDFDADIVIHTNTVLANLVQMGIGPDEGFAITIDGNEKWEDFITDGDTNILSQVKSYVGLSVKTYFDPDASGILKEARDAVLKELAYRMYIYMDNKKSTNKEAKQ